MTYALKLTGPTGEWEVDLSTMHPNFTFQYNNPIISIPTPMDETDVLNPKNKWSVVTLNLNMSTQTILINFKEQSGLTTNGGTLNLVSPTTTFEKILKLACDYPTEAKKLYINDTSEEFGDVEIEGYNATIPPGGKDYVEHSLTLVLSSPLGKD